MADVPFWDYSYEDPNTADIISIGSEGPLFARNPWDRVSLGGVTLPGIAEVSAKAKRKHDKKKENGTDGSTPTFHGYDPAQVTINIRVWTADQLQNLVEQLRTLWPAPAKGGKGTPKGVKEPPPFDIYHPKLAMLNITQVVIVEVDALKPGKVPGEQVLSLMCLEFKPPPDKKRNASSTPTRSVENRIAPKEAPKKNKPGETTLQSKSAPSNQNQSTPGNDKNFTGPEG